MWMTKGAVGAQEARWAQKDSAMVADIHRHILGQGACVEDLRILCKDIVRVSAVRLSRCGHSLGRGDVAQSGGTGGLAAAGDGPALGTQHHRAGLDAGGWRRSRTACHSCLGGSVGSSGAIEAKVVVVREFEELTVWDRTD